MLARMTFLRKFFFVPLWANAIKLPQLPRLAVDDEIGDVPAIKYSLGTISFQFVKNQTSFLGKNIRIFSTFIYNNFITHKFTDNFTVEYVPYPFGIVAIISAEMCKFCLPISPKHISPYKIRFFICAVYVTFKRRFQLRSCFSNLNGLFATCYKLTPLRMYTK